MKLKSLTLILAVALGAQVAFAQQSVTDPSVEFAPHWYGQIQGGAGYTIGETTFKDLISPAGALSFGYQFNPALGLRFGASGYQGKGNVVYPFELYKFNYAQGNVDLTLDLANLIRYNHQRVFNPYIFAGLGVAYGFNNGATKVASSGAKFDLLWEKNMISPVGRLGIGSAIRLSDAVALTLELNDNILSDRFNSKKVGHPDYQFNALLGLKINFGKAYRPSAKYLADLAAAEAAAAALQAQKDAERAAQLAAEKAARNEAIGKFLTFFYDPANYVGWVSMEGFLPAVNSAVGALVEADPSFEAWLSVLDSAKFYPTTKAEWNDVKQGVIRVEQTALTGGDVKTLLDDLQATITGK